MSRTALPRRDRLTSSSLRYSAYAFAWIQEPYMSLGSEAYQWNDRKLKQGFPSETAPLGS